MTAKTIALVVTGECERKALPAALKRAFPAADFELVQGRYDPFTSGTLPAEFVHDDRVETNAEKIVAALLGAVTDRRSADIAIAIDDLEVANRAHPANVISYLRGAARSVLSREDRTHRSERCLRERCSVHLLCPMLEAWFYGDVNSLVAAGVPATAAVRRVPGDVEAFEVDDPAYLTPDDEPKRSRKQGVRRWATSDRRYHPKNYLIYLTETVPGGERYFESTGGVAALEALRWDHLLASQSEARFARSLVEDIANMLEQPNPWPGECAAATWLSDSTRVFRNT